MPPARSPIRVHIACDDPAYRNAIAGMLADDLAIEIAEASPEAEKGAVEVEKTKPDVVVLAVPPNEDVGAHARRYRSASPEHAGVVGFCTLNAQAEAYRRAGVETLVFPGDTAQKLRDAIRTVRPNGGRSGD